MAPVEILVMVASGDIGYLSKVVRVILKHFLCQKRLNL